MDPWRYHAPQRGDKTGSVAFRREMEGGRRPRLLHDAGRLENHGREVELLVRWLPADLAGDRELGAGGRDGAAADDRDREVVGAPQVVDCVRLVAERLPG